MKLRFTACLLACLVTVSGAAWAQEQVTLMVHWPSGSPYYQLLQEYIDEYNAGRENVKVQLVTGGNLPAMLEQFLVQSAAGVPPQAINLWDNYRESLAGQLVPLRGVTLERMREAYLPFALEMAEHQGEVIGFPTEAQFPAVVYNSRMFEEAGLPPQAPATWEELFAFTRRLAKNTGDAVDRYGLNLSPARIARDLVSYVYSEGGALFAEDGTPLVNTSETLAAVETFKGLVDERAASFTGFGNAAGGFSAQKAAMTISEPWIRNSLVSAQADAYRDGVFRTAASPVGSTGKGYVWQYGYTWSVVNTPLVAETIEFLEWLTLEETSEATTRMGNILAIIGSVMVTRADIARQPMLDEVFMGGYLQAMDQSTFLKLPEVPGISQAHDVLQFGMRDILQGNVQPIQGLERVQTEIESKLGTN